MLLQATHLGVRDYEAQRLAMVLHFVLGKQDLPKHLWVTGLGDVIWACEHQQALMGVSDAKPV